MDKKYFTDFVVVESWTLESGVLLPDSVQTNNVIIDIFQIVTFEQCEDNEEWINVILKNGKNYLVTGYKLDELAHKICNIMSVILQDD